MIEKIVPWQTRIIAVEMILFRSYFKCFKLCHLMPSYHICIWARLTFSAVDLSKPKEYKNRKTIFQSNALYCWQDVNVAYKGQLNSNLLTCVCSYYGSKMYYVTWEYTIMILNPVGMQRPRLRRNTNIDKWPHESYCLHLTYICLRCGSVQPTMRR